MTARKKKSSIRETIEAIIVAFLIALVIRTFIIQAFKIPSGSMIPTLLVGDHILVNKFLLGTPVDAVRIIGVLQSGAVKLAKKGTA